MRSSPKTVVENYDIQLRIGPEGRSKIDSKEFSITPPSRISTGADPIKRNLRKIEYQFEAQSFNVSTFSTQYTLTLHPPRRFVDMEL